MKRDDALRLPVFEYGEGGSIEVRYDVILVVLHGGVQKDFVHIFLENENSLIVQILLVFFLIRLGGIRFGLRFLGS